MRNWWFYREANWIAFKFELAYFAWVHTRYNPCNNFEQPASPLATIDDIERVYLPHQKTHRYVPTNRAVFGMLLNTLDRQWGEYRAIEGKVVDPFESITIEFGQRK